MPSISIDLLDVLFAGLESEGEQHNTLAGGTHDSIPGKNLVYMVDSRRRGHHAVVSGYGGR